MGNFRKLNKWSRAEQSHFRGVEKVLDSPQQLYDLACDYFSWADANPILSTVVAGKNAELIEVPLRRVYNFPALCLHIGLDSAGFYKYREYPEYKDVIHFIENVIYSNKFEGAAAGIFNGNLIVRDLGLVDKKEVEQNQRLQIRITIPDNGRRVLRMPLQIEDVSDSL